MCTHCSHFKIVECLILTVSSCECGVWFAPTCKKRKRIEEVTNTFHDSASDYGEEAQHVRKKKTTSTNRDIIATFKNVRCSEAERAEMGSMSSTSSERSPLRPYKTLRSYKPPRREEGMEPRFVPAQRLPLDVPHMYIPVSIPPEQQRDDFRVVSHMSRFSQAMSSKSMTIQNLRNEPAPPPLPPPRFLNLDGRDVIRDSGWPPPLPAPRFNLDR